MGRDTSEAPRTAFELAEDAIGLFWDEDAGGFFFTAKGEGDGMARHKDVYDGAVPSGNSVMFMNLLRLGRLTGRHDLEKRSSRLAAAFSSDVAAHPRMHTEFLCGLIMPWGRRGRWSSRGGPMPRKRASFSRLRGGLALGTRPGCSSRPTAPEAAAAVERLAPFTKDMDAGGGRAAAYVCSEGACLRPVSSAAELVESLLRPPNVTSGRRRTRP